MMTIEKTSTKRSCQANSPATRITCSLTISPKSALKTKWIENQGQGGKKLSSKIQLSKMGDPYGGQLSDHTVFLRRFEYEINRLGSYGQQRKTKQAERGMEAEEISNGVRRLLEFLAIILLSS